MAARKKKAAKKAVKRVARKASAKKKSASKRRPRHQPETLRVRSFAPGYTVDDLTRSIAWYTNVLGMVANERWEMDGKLMGIELKAGTSSLWLSQDDWKKGRDRKKGEGVRIFCMTAQDVDMLAKGIKSRGGVLDHDPQTQSWGGRDFGVTDPDGYRITISSM